jgi:hypothetical protein
MWTFGPDVTGDAAVMTGGQASFVGMLLDFVCRNLVSILTNNIALTFICLLGGGTYFDEEESSTSLFLRASCLIQDCGISTNNNLA